MVICLKECALGFKIDSSRVQLTQRPLGRKRVCDLSGIIQISNSLLSYGPGISFHRYFINYYQNITSKGILFHIYCSYMRIVSSHSQNVCKKKFFSIVLPLRRPHIIIDDDGMTETSGDMP